ncbi:MAG TPA: tyrosine-type recombinase/integrase [Chloroflexota bacterium]|nr:tyrosine-type recombinase/integrase [Chloroflexota bacterium]
MFTTADGQPLRYSAVTKGFQRLLRLAGLPRQRFHDLRHACASLLLAQGVQPRVAMELLGHSQLNTTMERVRYEPMLSHSWAGLSCPADARRATPARWRRDGRRGWGLNGAATRRHRSGVSCPPNGCASSRTFHRGASVSCSPYFEFPEQPSGLPLASIRRRKSDGRMRILPSTTAPNEPTKAAAGRSRTARLGTWRLIGALLR